MKITVTLSDQEVADIQAEIDAMDVDVKPSISDFVAALIGAQVVAPISSRQKQYRTDRLMARLRDSGLADKLAALPPQQQDAIQAMVVAQLPA